MKNDTFLRTLASILTVCLVGFGLYYLSFMPPDTLAVWNNSTPEEPFGTIVIHAQDGWEKTPVENVQIVIPELNQTYTTDAEGKTPLIEVPIGNNDPTAPLPKPWKEITVLAYKEGYIDCAIFYVHVWENQTRSGPTVYMFPLTAGGNNQPFSLTEGPHRLWVSQMLEKFRPKK